MKVSRLVSFFIISSFCVLQATNEYITPLLKADPAETIIAIDLHDVLFYSEYFPVEEVSTQVDRVDEEGMELDSQPISQIPVRQIKNWLPNTEVVALITALKERGYQIYILSNICRSHYKKLQRQFPEVLDLFDGYHLPDKLAGYATKPSPLFYESFKLYIQEEQGDKQILFIDDKLINIQGAFDCGISGIHFTTLEDLVQRLVDLHFMSMDRILSLDNDWGCK